MLYIFLGIINHPLTGSLESTEIAEKSDKRKSLSSRTLNGYTIGKNKILKKFFMVNVMDYNNSLLATFNLPLDVWDKHILIQLDPISLKVFTCVSHLFYEMGNQHLVTLVVKNRDLKLTMLDSLTGTEVQLFDQQIMDAFSTELPNSSKIASLRQYLNSKKIKEGHLLHCFARKKPTHEREIFDLLIHLGMNPNLILHHNQPTALHSALGWSLDISTEERVKIGMQLIEAGADTRVKDLYDKTIFEALRATFRASPEDARNLNESQISRLEQYANAQMIRTGLYKKPIPKINEAKKRAILEANRRYFNKEASLLNF